MPDIRAAIVGLRQLERAAEREGRRYQRMLRQPMQESVLLVEAEVKRRAPGSRYKRSIHSQVRGVGGRIRGLIQTADRRGPWLEFGTGIYHVPNPHSPWTIVPVNRKALTIPVGKDAKGASARWAVRDLGPFQYERMKGPDGRLLFRTPKGGSTVREGRAQPIIMRKKVTIKGMRPRPHFHPAWKAKRREVEEIFRRYVVKLNRMIADEARRGGTGS